MDERDRQTPRDPDDWFDEPEHVALRRRSRASGQVDPDAQTREQAALPADDWLAPEAFTRTRRPMPIGNGRLLIAFGIALALLLVGLAFGGVFSGGGKKRAKAPPPSQAARTTTQTTPQTVALPAAPLRLGANGNAVKELQRALRTLGFTIGAIDGVFGTATEQALIAFQTAHHLSPDGVFGPASRSALLNALRPG